MKRIESRGNPNGPSLDGTEHELIHFKVNRTSDGAFNAKPICLNGAYNLRWTQTRNLVTCPTCNFKLKKFDFI